MLVGASARTINFSQDGMYFVSDMEFHPGSTVLIRQKTAVRIIKCRKILKGRDNDYS